ncbi:hypothetical protein L9F63_019838 [Diploptera punctata]|uniref:Uncharacterized protein n=1 Tax=Diploptera punctata TaxID=6984 RepID=A0AAD8EE80_DIPPU|nr:hypothetical protein L9F63_019838 [Diploptera punctata]
MYTFNQLEWKGVEEKRCRGEFVSLLPHLKCDDTKFYEYFRMSMYTFNQLEWKLWKQGTMWRQSITHRERLSVCLRYVNINKIIRTVSA